MPNPQSGDTTTTRPSLFGGVIGDLSTMVNALDRGEIWLNHSDLRSRRDHNALLTEPP